MTSEPHQDNRTHHLVPRRSGTGNVHVCSYCGRTERELREQLPVELEGEVTHQICPAAP